MQKVYSDFYGRISFLIIPVLGHCLLLNLSDRQTKKIDYLTTICSDEGGLSQLILKAFANMVTKTLGFPGTPGDPAMMTLTIIILILLLI